MSKEMFDLWIKNPKGLIFSKFQVSANKTNFPDCPVFSEKLAF